MGFDLNAKFVLRPNPESTKKTAVKHPFPTPCTVEEALKKYVDLRGPLRKKLLADIA